jgi:hypothetical protein
LTRRLESNALCRTKLVAREALPPLASNDLFERP